MLFVKDPCSCPRDYGKGVSEPNLMTACMVELGLDLERIFGTPANYFNCLNVNAYFDGNQALGYRSDDEPLFGDASADTIHIGSSSRYRRVDLHLRM